MGWTRAPSPTGATPLPLLYTLVFMLSAVLKTQGGIQRHKRQAVGRDERGFFFVRVYSEWAEFGFKERRSGYDKKLVRLTIIIRAQHAR